MLSKLLQLLPMYLLVTPTLLSAQHNHGVTAPAGDRMSVGVLIYEHAIMGDYAMAAEAFRVAEMGRSFDVFSIGLSVDPVETMDGIVNPIKPSRTLEDVDELDVLIVPGGNWHAVRNDKRLHRWLRALSDDGTIILSVCSGAYVLAHAGLLDGKEATSLPIQLDMLREFAPEAKVVEGKAVVADGNIVTASGGGTGLDGALRIIKRLASDETAEWVARTYFNYRGWAGYD
jgi:transcriptional regulator GlxA family with amidase domain